MLDTAGGFDRRSARRRARRRTGASLCTALLAFVLAALTLPATSAEARESAGCERQATCAEDPAPDELEHFEPPTEPYSLADRYGHTVEQCYFDRAGKWAKPSEGRWDPHCGLGGLQEHWECQVYYGTAYGTARGCLEGAAAERDLLCSRPLHLYDGTGRGIARVPSCPRVRTEQPCAARRCAPLAPPRWTCRREHWSFGPLYGGERRTLTRCASPEFYEYIDGERPPCKRRDAKLISALYDERGERIDGMSCTPGGTGSDLGEWAGLEAREADDALQGAREPRTSGRGSPERGRGHASGEQRPESPQPSDSPEEPSAARRSLEEAGSGVASAEDRQRAASHAPSPPGGAGNGAPPVDRSGAPSAAGDTARASAGEEHLSSGRTPPESGRQRSVPEPASGESGAAPGGAAFAAHELESPEYDALSAGERGSGSLRGATRGAVRRAAGPERQSGWRATAREQSTPPESGVAPRPAARLLAASPTSDGPRAESTPGGAAGEESAGTAAWPGHLVPFGGLAAAVAGVFALRRRFLI